jgi:branched-chain amino acid transport system permease protein
VTELLQQLVDGLGRGSTYALVALGLAIVFGVMHLVNFAHGELITVSAYVMYWLSVNGQPWWVMAVLAVGSAVVTAVVIEFVAFRWVRGQSEFTLLMTSFGVHFVVVALFTMNVAGGKGRVFSQPDWINDQVEALGVRFEVYDLVVIGVTAVALVGLTLLMRRTMFGVALRAAAEDFDAARLMGVRSNRVISGAFALSGLLAGVAAVLIMMRTAQAEPTSGLSPLLKGVIATIIGGLGSLSGAVVGGLLLGVAEVLLRSRLPEGIVGLTDAIVFGLIAVLFVFRPSGLVAAKRVERV